jgi:hypothetical protein
MCKLCSREGCSTCDNLTSKNCTKCEFTFICHDCTYNPQQISNENENESEDEDEQKDTQIDNSQQQ